MKDKKNAKESRKERENRTRRFLFILLENIENYKRWLRFFWQILIEPSERNRTKDELDVQSLSHFDHWNTCLGRVKPHALNA